MLGHPEHFWQPWLPILKPYTKIYLGNGEKYEKNQSLEKNFFFNASIRKMVPKGFGNEKNIQSMLTSLQTAKNW